MNTQLLGRYRLIAELARGGMGIVYLAMARGPSRFQKLVVLKELSPAHADDPAIVDMFLDEARLSARLAHHNVVQTHEVNSEKGRHFITMEYLEGQSWDSVVRRAKREEAPVPLQLELRVIVGMLAGLHYAHELADFDGQALQIVHRDVSPHNVFVTYDGEIKVVDFGIAKALDSSRHTQTGQVKGKIAYMSPEQARGEKVDRRSDIFSAGVMLYQAIAQRRFWANHNDMAIVSALLAAKVPRLADVAPDSPPELLAIVNRATAPDRADRYATAAELAADLEAYLAKETSPLGARDLGRFVSDLFSADRARIRAQIEEQTRILNSASTGELEAVGMLVIRNSEAVLPTSEISAVATKTPARLAQERGTVVHSPPQRSSRWTWVALGGALVIALASAGLVATRRGEARPDAVASPPLVASSGASLAPTVRIVVRAMPSSARIFIDGKPVEGNPFIGHFPRDARSHVVGIEATGFAPKHGDYTFDEDLAIDVNLDALAVPSPPPVPSANAPSTAVNRATKPVTAKTAASSADPPPPAPTPSATVAPATPRAKTPRPLETSDPYAH